MKTTIVSLNRNGDFGVYRGARLLFRGTLAEALAFRRNHG